MSFFSFLVFLFLSFHTFTLGSQIKRSTTASNVKYQTTGKVISDKFLVSVFFPIKHGWERETKCEKLPLLWDMNQDINYMAVGDSKQICSSFTRKYPKVKCFVPACGIERNLSCYLASIQQISSTSVTMLTYQDVLIHTPSLISTIQSTKATLNKFVLVGNRLNVQDSVLRLYCKVNFASNYSVKSFSSDLFEDTHNPQPERINNGIDYFIFTNDSFSIPNLPPFTITQPRWDHWLLHETIRLNETAVIDVTETVRIIRFGETVYPKPRRGMGNNNDIVWKSTKYSGFSYSGIGSVRYAPYYMKISTGKTPKFKIVYNQTNLAASVARYVHSSGYVVIVTVTSGYFELIKNFLCWAERAGLSQYFFLAMDQSIHKTLSDMGLPVIRPLSLPLDSRPKDYGRARSESASVSVAFEYMTLSYQTLMTLRTQALLGILQMGFGFVTVDADTVWLQNPLETIFRLNCDMFGQTHKEYNISGGFVGIPATTFGLSFWRTVTSCQERNLAYLRTLGRETKLPDINEQECINDHLAALREVNKQKNKSSNICRLGHTFIADGKAVFFHQTPQKAGVFPAIVHANYLFGSIGKIQKLKSWNLWLVNETRMTCLDPNKQHPRAMNQPNLLMKNPKPSLMIRILTMNRPNSLSRLLASLAAADYGSDEVSMEIFVDKPSALISSNSSGDSSVSDDYERVLRIVDGLQWSHGNLTVVKRNESFGLFRQWVQKAPDYSLLLVLEDDLEVSPMFYRWARAVLSKYGAAKNLFGFSFQRQHTLLGRSVKRKYPPDCVDPVIKGNKELLYRYQLMSSWGPFFFPSVWNRFVEWAWSQRFALPLRPPCVPGLYSNKWAIQKTDKIWTIWFLKFAFENGIYNLYLNYNLYDNSTHRVSLIRNYREQGLNFRGGQQNDKFDQFELLGELPPPDAQFLPLQILPLYDYHLRKVPKEKWLEDRWRIVSNVSEPCYFVS